MLLLLLKLFNILHFTHREAAMCKQIWIFCVVLRIFNVLWIFWLKHKYDDENHKWIKGNINYCALIFGVLKWKKSRIIKKCNYLYFWQIGWHFIAASYLMWIIADYFCQCLSRKTVATERTKWAMTNVDIVKWELESSWYTGC